MSTLFRNTRKLSMILSSLLLVVTLTAGSLAYMAQGGDITDKPVSEADLQQEEPLPDDTDAEPEEDIVVPEPVHFNVPTEMRGVFLTPGSDFIKTQDTSANTICAEIDKAIANAKELTMNAVIIDTTYGDRVIYQTSAAPEVSSDFDIMAYIVEKARENSMYTYAIFDASFYESGAGTALLSIGGAGGINKLNENAAQFAEKYELDGILIDGYTNKGGTDSYSEYISVGGAIGFDNFMRQTPAAVVKTVSKAVRKAAPGTQVGLLADAVWANQADNEQGSNTKAAFTALETGNADTKSYVERGLVDFIAVKAYASLDDTAAPFKEVVSWWAGVAGENMIPMYVVHASDKACTQEPGWAAHDQLAKQVIEASELSGFGGSIFNSLAKLVENPKDSATTLLKYYNQEIAPEYILTELEVTKPAKTEYTTTEPVVTFTGASDPTSKVTINGDEIQTDSSGYFTVTRNLKAGENKFTISHKEKDINYVITRQVQILKEVSPVGSISTEGSMSIMITALAYSDAEVYATVNGTTVPMAIEESGQDEADRDSSFRLFAGEYVAPSATTEVQNLGAITVHGSWQGQKETQQGASIKVNKKAKLEDGVSVAVIANQAMTYPANTLNNIPHNSCYPLPKGAMDYAVGDEIVYKKGSDTYTYTVLASGMRVESKDIQPLSSDYVGSNGISGMSVAAPGDGFTYVTLKTAQKVTYAFSYKGDSVQIQFFNTVKAPGGSSLDKNPLFTKASWSNNDTLTLTFAKQGCFMGYKGYYDADGNLVFKFNNPPASIKGARIAIDPGHGGKDYGALGFLADFPEKTINLAIAQQLADELESRGATVKLLESAGIEGTQRMQLAEQFNADLFVSIHNNTAPNAAAVGTEVYYFYPYSKTLAASASSNVSSQLSTTNRGAKQSYYYVTLSPQMASVLVECGFMSNKTEYEKLIKSKYQQRIATGIADALAATVKATYSGVDSSGSQSTGSGATAGGEVSSPDPDPDPGEGEGDSGVTGVELNRDTMSLAVGKTSTLKATVEPGDAKNKSVSFKSSNTSVATVDKNGVVTAKKAGSAKITVTTSDGGYTASCAVTVTKAGSSSTVIEVEDIGMISDDQTISVGKSVTLEVDVYPYDADDTSVTWSTSSSSVATVTSSGKVTGVKAGTATITATTNDGTKLKATCKITVTSDSSSDSGDSDTGIALSKANEAYIDNDYLVIYPGYTQRVEIVTDKGELIRNSDFKWTSSKTSVATVDAFGVVTAKSVGDATITAKGGDYTLYCDISVSKTKVAVKGITLNKTSLSIVKDKKEQLKATITPSDATNKKIIWSSTNTNVATVDSNGFVTAKKAGKTSINARTEDGNFIAKCALEVTRSDVEIDSLEIFPDMLEIMVGETDQLWVNIYPENATDSGVTWKSSKSDIVSVDQEGNIEAVKAGTATITCSSNTDSSVYATCKIIVIS